MGEERISPCSKIERYKIMSTIYGEKKTSPKRHQRLKAQPELIKDTGPPIQCLEKSDAPGRLPNARTKGKPPPTEVCHHRK